MQLNKTADKKQPQDQDSKNRKENNVGILYVHGIGEQKKADTLMQFGEPLRKWLTKWMAQGENFDEAQIVQVRSANLGQDNTERIPVHAKLTIQSLGVKAKWIIAESWWAQSFPSPQYSDLLRWAFQILPWIIASHSLRRIKLAKGSTRIAFQIMTFFIVVTLLPFLVIVVLMSLLIGILPIPKLRSGLIRMQQKLLGTVGDSYALVGSSISGAAMITRILDDLKWLQDNCDKTILLAHSQGAAIAHAALKARSIHSPDIKQPELLITFGAGLRKLLLLDQAGGKEIGFSWLLSLGLGFFSWEIWKTLSYFWTLTGSNMNWFIIPISAEQMALFYNQYGMSLRDVYGFDFSDMRWLLGAVSAYGFVSGWFSSDRHWFSRFGIALGAAATFCVGAFIIFHLINAGTYLFLLFGIIAVVVSLATLWSSQEIQSTLQLDPAITWRDFYASSDPVPNGPLVESSSGTGIDSKPVSNRGSIFSDHTSYWENQDEFVSSVACEIGKVGNIDFASRNYLDNYQIQRAKKRRAWRVQWLKISRISLILTGVLYALGLHRNGATWKSQADLPFFINLVLQDLHTLIQKIPILGLGLPNLGNPWFLQLLWFLTGILVLWVVYQSIFSIWLWWDHQDTETFFKREDYQFFTIPFVIFLCLIAGTVGSGIAIHMELNQLWDIFKTDPELQIIWSEGFEGLSKHPLREIGLFSIFFMGLFFSAAASAIAFFIASYFRWGAQTWRLIANDYGSVIGGIGKYLLLALPFNMICLLWFYGVGTSHPYRFGLSLMDDFLWPFIFGFTLIPLAVCLLLGSDFLIRIIGKYSLLKIINEHSASGPLFSCLGSRNYNVDSSQIPQGILIRRAKEIVAEWDHESHTVRSSKNASGFSTLDSLRDESVEVIRALYNLQSEKSLLTALALARVFPYAALELSQLFIDKDPSKAKIVAEYHRGSLIPEIRWKINKVLKLSLLFIHPLS